MSLSLIGLISLRIRFPGCVIVCVLATNSCTKAEAPKQVGNQTLEGPSVQISGVAQAGPIKGDVTVYELLDSGERGKKVAITTSDENGRFAVKVPASNAPVIIAVTGTYTDEATSQLVDMKGQELTQILPDTNADQQAPVTPLSTMVHDAVVEEIRSKKSNPSGIVTLIETRSSDVAALFGVPDSIIKEIPAKPDGATLDTPAGQAASVLIVLSQAMKNTGLTPDKNINPIEAFRILSKEFASNGSLSGSSESATASPEVKSLSATWAQQLAISQENLLANLKSEAPKEWMLPKVDTKRENAAPVAYAQKIKVVGSAAVSPIKATDPNHDAVKFIVVEQGKKGTVTFIDNFSGLIKYEPSLPVVGDPSIDAVEGVASSGALADVFSYKVSDGRLESSTEMVEIERVPLSGVVAGKCYEKGKVIAELPNGKGYCPSTGKFYIDNSVKRGLDSEGNGVESDLVFVGGNLANKVIDGACYQNGKWVPGVVEGTGFCLGDMMYYVDSKPQKDLDELGQGLINGLVYRGGSLFTGVEDKKCFRNGESTDDLDAQGTGVCDSLRYVNGLAANGLIGSDCYSDGQKANSLINGTGWCHGIAVPASPKRFYQWGDYVRVAFDKDENLIVAGPSCVRKVFSAYTYKNIAGTCGSYGYVDATGINARFNWIQGIGVLSDGTIYLSDLSTDDQPVVRIRKISNSGVVSTLLEKPLDPASRWYYGLATRSLSYYDRGSPILGVTVDSDGNIYFSDAGIYRMSETSQPVKLTGYGYGNESIRKLEMTKDNKLAYYHWYGSSLILNPKTASAPSGSEPASIVYYLSGSNGSSSTLPEGDYFISEQPGAKIVAVRDGMVQSIPLLGDAWNWGSFSWSEDELLNGTLTPQLLGLKDSSRLDFREIYEDVFFAPGGAIYGSDSGRLFKMSRGQYYKDGAPQETFNALGSGLFQAKRFVKGAVFSGYSEELGECYVDGVKDQSFNLQGSYCAGQVYVVNGRPKPGLDANGNGVSGGDKFINGVLASGLIEGVYYDRGKPFTGSASYIDGGKYYVDGIVYTGLANGKYYAAGVLFTGFFDGKSYEAGDLFTGLRNGQYYKDGLPGTGLFNYRYYVNGSGASGVYNDVLYENGDPVNKTINGTLYVNGKIRPSDIAPLGGSWGWKTCKISSYWPGRTFPTLGSLGYYGFYFSTGQSCWDGTKATCDISAYGMTLERVGDKWKVSAPIVWKNDDWSSESIELKINGDVTKYPVTFTANFECGS